MWKIEGVFFPYTKAHFVFHLFTKQTICPIKRIQDVEGVRGYELKFSSVKKLQRFFFYYSLNCLPSGGDHQNISTLVKNSMSRNAVLPQMCT